MKITQSEKEIEISNSDVTSGIILFDISTITSGVEYVSGNIPSGSGQYTGLTQKSTTGSGSGAIFYFVYDEFSAPIIRLFAIDNLFNQTGGRDYQLGDNIVISGADVGGVDGVDDVTFIVVDVTENTLESKIITYLENISLVLDEDTGINIIPGRTTISNGDINAISQYTNGYSALSTALEITNGFILNSSSLSLPNELTESRILTSSDSILLESTYVPTYSVDINNRTSVELTPTDIFIYGDNSIEIDSASNLTIVAKDELFIRNDNFKITSLDDSEEYFVASPTGLTISSLDKVVTLNRLSELEIATGVTIPVTVSYFGTPDEVTPSNSIGFGMFNISAGIIGPDEINIAQISAPDGIQLTQFSDGTYSDYLLKVNSQGIIQAIDPSTLSGGSANLETVLTIGNNSGNNNIVFNDDFGLKSPDGNTKIVLNKGSGAMSISKTSGTGLDAEQILTPSLIKQIVTDSTTSFSCGLNISTDNFDLYSRDDSITTASSSRVSANSGIIQMTSTDGTGTFGIQNSVGNTTIDNETIALNTGLLNLKNLPTYSSNADAIADGLLADYVYKTNTGELIIVV